MVPGFNTDFKYRGETYHVQTEDNGLSNPVVVTLLYHKGAILASRKTSYRDLVDTPGYEQELKSLMKAQHKDLMRELLAGNFDKDGAAPAAAGGTGGDPATAAAAIAATAALAPKPRPEAAMPLPAPAARTVAPPAPKPQPVPPPRQPQPPRPERVPFPMPLVPIARPAAPPVQAKVPAPASLTLDEAIRRYLENFAVTAAAPQ